jgi:hypothetical protein
VVWQIRAKKPESVVENIALFGGKRPQINLRATIQRPINRAFGAQNRIYPVPFCSSAIYRGAVTARGEPMFVTSENTEAKSQNTQFQK